MAVGIGIVGVGQVSDYHHFPGIDLDPRAKLVGVCDTNPDLVVTLISATDLISDFGCNMSIPDLAATPISATDPVPDPAAICPTPIWLRLRFQPLTPSPI
jgi:predicted dehydrogenase